MSGKLALYFGCRDGLGHFLHGMTGPRTSLDPTADVPGFPWDIGLLDGGLLNNRKVPDRPDGRVQVICGGRPDFWFAFVWWDRSVDKRGASNSGFYVRWPMPEVTSEAVEEAAPEAFAFACSVWPRVVARQLHPLALQGLPLATPTPGEGEG